MTGTQLFDTTGKVALITGASSGMGKAIAHAIGIQGAQVIVSSNDEGGCERTVKAFEGEGINAVAIPCDVTDKNQIDILVEEAIKKFGQIDVLVSCVGIGPAAPFMETDSDLYDKVMGINLQSAIYLTKKIIPQMAERHDGVIIYLASIASVRGNKNIGLYGVSKAGLVQLARNLAVEYGPQNIRVNTISPGLINTLFSDSLFSNREFMEKRLQLTPLRRVGQPEEIAGVAAMLASKAGAFITGQNIIVDGGTTISDGN